jgi:predicted nucleic acid-binding Zn ribbon protein
LEENSSLALDARKKERERKRNKRMTMVLSLIALTFAVSRDVRFISFYKS